MRTKRTVVVDQNGDVVATHAPSLKQVENSIIVQSGLKALAGQTLHEIEFEVPDTFRNEHEVIEFHRP
jgi:hypothetical protein